MYNIRSVQKFVPDSYRCN